MATDPAASAGVPRFAAPRPTKRTCEGHAFCPGLAWQSITLCKGSCTLRLCRDPEHHPGPHAAARRPGRRAQPAHPPDRRRYRTAPVRGRRRPAPAEDGQRGHLRYRRGPPGLPPGVREETEMTYTAAAGELTTAPSTTRRLLAGGALAAPLFVVSALAQAATRPGYDLTRHPVSVLSNGDLGWIQIGTFLVTGFLTLGYAVAARRVLSGGRAGTWGPVLLAVQGAGLVVAGAFRLDPLDEFPPGTPAGQPASMSWH